MRMMFLACPAEERAAKQRMKMMKIIWLARTFLNPLIGPKPPAEFSFTPSRSPAGKREGAAFFVIRILGLYWHGRGVSRKLEHTRKNWGWVREIQDIRGGGKSNIIF
jgi:hypothetical protein